MSKNFHFVAGEKGQGGERERERGGKEMCRTIYTGNNNGKKEKGKKREIKVKEKF